MASAIAPDPINAIFFLSIVASFSSRHYKTSEPHYPSGIPFKYFLSGLDSFGLHRDSSVVHLDAVRWSDEEKPVSVDQEAGMGFARIER
jgi:hypothetical protein